MLVIIAVSVVVVLVITILIRRAMRVRRSLQQLALWPQRGMTNRDAAVRELLECAASALRATRAAVAWRESDGASYVARLDGGTFEVSEEPLDAQSPIVAKFETPAVRGSLHIFGRRRASADDRMLVAIAAKLVTAGLEQVAMLPRRPRAIDPRERLSAQLARMKNDIAVEWNLRIDLDADPNLDLLDRALARHLMTVVAEGLTNAAKHAGATRIACDVRIEERAVRVDIADDGHGFPFHGHYELTQLVAERRGPWSLKERIVALGGELAIDSSEHGSRVEVRLPRAS